MKLGELELDDLELEELTLDIDDHFSNYTFDNEKVSSILEVIKRARLELSDVVYSSDVEEHLDVTQYYLLKKSHLFISKLEDSIVNSKSEELTSVNKDYDLEENVYNKNKTLIKELLPNLSTWKLATIYVTIYPYTDLNKIINSSSSTIDELRTHMLPKLYDKVPMKLSKAYGKGYWDENKERFFYIKATPSTHSEAMNDIKEMHTQPYLSDVKVKLIRKIISLSEEE